MYRILLISCVLCMALLHSNSHAVDCNSEHWTEYKNIDLFKLTEASAYYFVTTHMAIDADGAPNAYHPDDIGLDYLANAGYPDKAWWKDVLAVDPENPDRAYVQDSGEFSGYFVSKTSLQDTAQAVTDPKRYVDARHIPYLVFPGAFYRMKGTGILGDLGLAVNLSSGAKTAFVIADIGPTQAPLGEVSISLAERLGGQDVSPRTGAGVPQGRILYILFPYSGRDHKWPLSYQQMSEAVEGLLRSAGGLDAVLSCVNAP